MPTRKLKPFEGRHHCVFCGKNFKDPEQKEEHNCIFAPLAKVTTWM